MAILGRLRVPKNVQILSAQKYKENALGPSGPGPSWSSEFESHLRFVFQILLPSTHRHTTSSLQHRSSSPRETALAALVVFLGMGCMRACHLSNRTDSYLGLDSECRRFSSMTGTSLPIKGARIQCSFCTSNHYFVSTK